MKSKIPHLFAQVIEIQKDSGDFLIDLQKLSCFCLAKHLIFTHVAPRGKIVSANFA